MQPVHSMDATVIRDAASIMAQTTNDDMFDDALRMLAVESAKAGRSDALPLLNDAIRNLIKCVPELKAKFESMFSGAAVAYGKLEELTKMRPRQFLQYLCHNDPELMEVYVLLLLDVGYFNEKASTAVDLRPFNMELSMTIPPGMVFATGMERGISGRHFLLSMLNLMKVTSVSSFRKLAADLPSLMKDNENVTDMVAVYSRLAYYYEMMFARQEKLLTGID